VAEKTGNGREPGLLDKFDGELLLSFGVPAVLLPAVRAVQQPDQLLALAKHLPAEAAEALIWLAEGLPPEEVREAVAAQPQKKIDTDDLATALEHPDSRRRFITIRSDHDLTSILDAPLEKWRVFLHPGQERLVTKHFNGPARVTGGAGTGKAIAIAVLTAACSEKTYREGQAVELVWTGPDMGVVPLRRTEQAILQVLDCASRRITVVSYAVYNIPHVCDALIRAARRGVATTIIVETPDRLEPALFTVLPNLPSELCVEARSNRGFHGNIEGRRESSHG
jgi:hypothetical protein